MWHGSRIGESFLPPTHTYSCFCVTWVVGSHHAVATQRYTECNPEQGERGAQTNMGHHPQKSFNARLLPELSRENHCRQQSFRQKQGTTGRARRSSYIRERREQKQRTTTMSQMVGETLIGETYLLCGSRLSQTWTYVKVHMSTDGFDRSGALMASRPCPGKKSAKKHTTQNPQITHLKKPRRLPLSRCGKYPSLSGGVPLTGWYLNPLRLLKSSYQCYDTCRPCFLMAWSHACQGEPAKRPLEPAKRPLVAVSSGYLCNMFSVLFRCTALTVVNTSMAFAAA